MKKQLSSKPLNCLYCSNAILTPGSSRTAYFKPIPPQPNCFCYDVPPELFDLYLIHNPDQGIDIYSWLPYHCGHFQPRMIQLRCASCGKPEQFEEWACVKDIFIQRFNVMTCDETCSAKLNRRLAS